MLTGRGAYIGLAKAVNGQELASPADTPDAITYQVATLDGDNLTVTLENSRWCLVDVPPDTRFDVTGCRQMAPGRRRGCVSWPCA